MKLIVFILLLVLTFYNLHSKGIRYEVPCSALVLVTAIDKAESQKGLVEKTGNNDGSHIENYLKSVGLNPKGHYPYCASGLYWSFSEAVKELNLSTDNIPVYRTGSANKMYDEARKKGRQSIYLPHSGDLLVWRLVTSYNGHIEMIIKKTGNGIYKTFGFNTSSGIKGSQSNGGGNYYRYRSIFDAIGRLQVRGIIGFTLS